MNEQVQINVKTSTPYFVKEYIEDTQPSVDQFVKWCDNAKPGDKFIYYTGFNLSDTILAKEIRKATYRFSVMGEVYLVQGRCPRRLSVFNWYAIKASKPPVFRLLPFSEEKIKSLQKIRGN